MSTKELKPCLWRSTFGVEPPSTKHSLYQKHVSKEDIYLVQEGMVLTEYNGAPKWGLYCVCDGHGGAEAAEFVKSHLWSLLKSKLPHEAPESHEMYESWAQSIRSAIRHALICIEDEFRKHYKESIAGSTLAVALVCGWLLTVANLGDTEAMLDTGEEILILTSSHRLEDSQQEQDRMREAGVTLARLCYDLSGPAAVGDEGLGPQRCWPGGLANSRSIGDMTGGQHILVSPFIKQCILPHRGCRLIVGTDGLWDCIDFKTACFLTRKCTNSAAASRLVTSVIYRNQWMVEDDTTALVVDFLPSQFQEFSQLYKAIKKSKKKRTWHSAGFLSCFCGSVADNAVVETNKDSRLETKDVVVVKEIDYALETEQEKEDYGTIMASVEALEDSSSEI
eukprot:g2968.t1